MLIKESAPAFSPPLNLERTQDCKKHATEGDDPEIQMFFGVLNCCQSRGQGAAVPEESNPQAKGARCPKPILRWMGSPVSFEAQGRKQASCVKPPSIPKSGKEGLVPHPAQPFVAPNTSKKLPCIPALPLRSQWHLWLFGMLLWLPAWLRK